MQTGIVMTPKPEDMSHLMMELSTALRELAHNMSNLAAALENDYLQQPSPLREATLLSAIEAIDKAKAR
jgi:primosomal protein N''